MSGLGEQLKEYTLGVEALGRGAAFDPRTDSIVRVEASRLRSRLDAYNASEGRMDPVRIVLPKGAYVPKFEWAVPIPRPVATRDLTWLWKISTLVQRLYALVSGGRGSVPQLLWQPNPS